ncbi:MAG: hypothetical protein AAF215_17505 [Cyanobacteria bacterium P01_A01_bin.123]
MQIINPTITHKHGSAEVKFPITPEELREIQEKQLFNYQEMLFKPALPSDPFSEGLISIVGASEKANNYQTGHSFSLNEKEWQILYIELDQQRYPTFFHLKREGEIKGSLVDAMVEFASNKAIEDEPEVAKSENFQLVKDFLENFINLGIQGELTEADIAKATSDFIAQLFESNDDFSLEASIQACLEDKGIPIDLEDGSFYFTVQNKEIDWDVKLILMEPERRVLAYSYISLNIDESLVNDILRDINALNLTFSHGNFELDTTQGFTLCFKNHIDVNPIDLERLFEGLLTENFDSMIAMIPALTERYGFIVQS